MSEFRPELFLKKLQDFLEACEVEYYIDKSSLYKSKQIILQMVEDGCIESSPSDDEMVLLFPYFKQEWEEENNEGSFPSLEEWVNS